MSRCERGLKKLMLPCYNCQHQRFDPLQCGSSYPAVYRATKPPPEPFCGDYRNHKVGERYLAAYKATKPPAQPLSMEITEITRWKNRYLTGFPSNPDRNSCGNSATCTPLVTGHSNCSLTQPQFRFEGWFVEKILRFQIHKEFHHANEHRKAVQKSLCLQTRCSAPDINDVNPYL